MPTLIGRDHYQKIQKMEQETEKKKERSMELPTLIARDHHQQTQEQEQENETEKKERLMEMSTLIVTDHYRQEMEREREKEKEENVQVQSPSVFHHHARLGRRPPSMPAPPRCHLRLPSGI